MKKRILSFMFVLSMIASVISIMSITASADIGTSANCLEDIYSYYPYAANDIFALKKITRCDGYTIEFSNNSVARILECKKRTPEGSIYTSYYYYDENNIFTSCDREDVAPYGKASMEMQYYEDGTYKRMGIYFFHPDGTYAGWGTGENFYWPNADTYEYNCIKMPGSASFSKIVTNSDKSLTCYTTGGQIDNEQINNWSYPHNPYNIYNKYDSYGRLLYDATLQANIYYDESGRLKRVEGPFKGAPGWIDFEYVSYDNYGLSISPSRGQSTINNQQGTGDTFIFTAITPPEVNEISLLADKFNGIEWHEIPFDYLQRNYHLEAYINNENEKVWTCRFGINDSGYRTFKLKIDGANTDIEANVTVIENNGSFSPTPQQGNISVVVNGEYVNFDVVPQIINGRTMIPVRAVAEAFNADVIWDGENQTVTIEGRHTYTNYDIRVSMKIGNNVLKQAWFGFTKLEIEKQVTLDSPPIIVDGRTLVPIRAIAETFGYNVMWKDDTRTVVIYAKDGRI